MWTFNRLTKVVQPPEESAGFIGNTTNGHFNGRFTLSSPATRIIFYVGRTRSTFEDIRALRNTPVRQRVNDRAATAKRGVIRVPPGIEYAFNDATTQNDRLRRKV